MLAKLKVTREMRARSKESVHLEERGETDSITSGNRPEKGVGPTSGLPQICEVYQVFFPQIL